MNIIVGISNIHSEEVIQKYANEGVDEFFFGYMPETWIQKYGWELSCNRRDYSNYHYYTIEQVENLVDIIHRAGKKAFLTLNAHEYNNDQVALLMKILKEIKHIPIDAYIVSNFALMLDLREQGIDTPINISIGSGGNSYEAIEFYMDNIDNIGRIVLPRKLSIKEIQGIAEKAVKRDIKLEAFGMADPCYFNDEYCFTWHGSSNTSFCESPMYKHKILEPIFFEKDWKSSLLKNDLSYYYEKRMSSETKIIKLKKQLTKERPIAPYTQGELNKLHILSIIRKCGLCAFQKFKDFGVDAIKLPLRGYSSVHINLSLINLVRTILDEPNASPQFCKKVIQSPNFCSGKNCFYNYPYSN
jgi:collagenase-like PrtC family protease